MADLFGKKPKPEQGLGSEQKPKLSQNSNGLNGAKVQPGSPDKMDHVPVGINKRKFESDKHADKRLNKMFKETNQPTLGVWNHDKKNNPIAKPDKVKFNPDLEYKPTKEQIDQAKLNRQKIINQGFAPAEFNKNSAEDSFYAGSPKGYREASQRIKDWGNKNKIQVDEKSTTGYYDEDPDFWAINDYEVFPGENGSYKIHKDGKEVGSANNDDELFNYVKGQNSSNSNASWSQPKNILNEMGFEVEEPDSTGATYFNNGNGDEFYYTQDQNTGLVNIYDKQGNIVRQGLNFNDRNSIDDSMRELAFGTEKSNENAEQPQANTAGQRKILKSMGYSDDAIDELFNMPETYGKN